MNQHSLRGIILQGLQAITHRILAGSSTCHKPNVSQIAQQFCRNFTLYWRNDDNQWVGASAKQSID